MKNQLKAYVDLAVDVAQNLNVDYIVVRGKNNVENQIRFSHNKIDINKQWQQTLLELLVVVEDNKVSIGEFTPSSEDYVREQITVIVNFAKKWYLVHFFKE
ncbi:MAG: hypothetical protein ACFE9L_11430 [Candidatus Hodarchaeota archaeon]